MMVRAVIFDLDGTLLDTLNDIATAMNTALIALGEAPHPVKSYREFVGCGLEILASRVLPENRRDQTTIAACVCAMRGEYARVWAQTTRPYPGIPELLETLREKKIKTSVLSNKAEDFTRKAVTHFFSSNQFEAVLGSSPAFPNKPDPMAALHIAKTLQVSPEETIFVGDSNIDMQTACNSGMFPLGVLWGFRDSNELLANGAKYLASHPEDISTFLFRS